MNSLPKIQYKTSHLLLSQEQMTKTSASNFSTEQSDIFWWGNRRLLQCVRVCKGHVFPSTHLWHITFSHTAWTLESFSTCHCLLPLPFTSPHYLLLSPSPFLFCLHSSFKQYPVLLLVTTRWFRGTLKPDSIVYVRVHNVVHTQAHHVEKYCPLHCPLLHLQFFHTHILKHCFGCLLTTDSVTGSKVKDTALDWMK